MAHCQITYRGVTSAAAPTEWQPNPEPVYGLRHIMNADLPEATKAKGEAHMKALLKANKNTKSQIEVLAVTLVAG